MCAVYSPVPLVSVCIPLYNGAAYLRDAIESVLAQTETDWELVITDDRSGDASPQIIASYSDPRIRYLENPERLGPEGNWNRCVNESRGVYCKLLCQDDRLHPDCLARQLAVFKQAESQSVSLVACARRIIGPSGHVLFSRRWKRTDQRVSGTDAIRQIIRCGTNPVGEPGAVLFRMADWKELSGFCARFPYVIDLDFWVKLLRRGDCFYLSDALCDFRISPQSWSLRLAGEQSRQFSGFIQDLAPAHRGRDVLFGMWKARAGAFLRQIIYFFICRRVPRKAVER